MIEFLPLWYVLSLLVIFYALKFYYGRFRVLEERTLRANCGRNGENITSLLNEMKEVRRDIEQVKIILANKYSKALDFFAMKNSPRKLNEMGPFLFSQVKGEEFLNSHRRMFFEWIDNEHPKTALDVEMAACMACNILSSNEAFNEIKNFVYNCPEVEVTDKNGEKMMYEITMNDVCFVLSIPLRDLYLKEHKEILEA